MTIDPLHARELFCRLHLYHLHTGEHLNVVYRKGDQYLDRPIAELNHFLRDHRTGEVKNYDIREFDLLHDLLVNLGRPDIEIGLSHTGEQQLSPQTRPRGCAEQPTHRSQSY